ncbi:hypothetical protein [Lysobacter sp. FW306-1B-D06B]|uniref:hypothetical protein n=1 Tax=Lysobacter sp. FW306-1B-D06B TaxID=3140250 RepID=UPI00313FF06D
MKAFGCVLAPLFFVAGACAASDQATAPATADAAPGTASSCGRVSIFDVAPRSQDLYRARVMNIDGKLAGPTGAKTFRLAPGKHTLQVAELINSDQFNDVQLRQRDMRADPYKDLVVDVAPNTTYLLAAHLIEAKRNSITDGSYWEPVIYQKNSEPCH